MGGRAGEVSLTASKAATGVVRVGWPMPANVSQLVFPNNVPNNVYCYSVDDEGRIGIVRYSVT